MKQTLFCDKISLDSNGCHLLIPVVLDNNLQSGYFIVDTGASKSVIDATILNAISHNVIEQDSIESSHLTAMIEGVIVNIDFIYFNDIHFQNFEAISMPLEHVNSIYSKFVDNPIYGLIGGDFLLKYNAEISYKSLQIILS